MSFPRFFLVVIPWFCYWVLAATNTLTRQEMRKIPETIAKEFIQDLATGKGTTVETHFDSSMKSALPPGQLQTIWNSLELQLGKLRKTDHEKTTNEQGYTVTRVRCDFENASLTGVFSFNPSGELAGLRFLPAQSEHDWQTPDYVIPENFEEQKFELVSNSYRLPAFLTLPKIKGPVPCVVLIAGSGPSDQDETEGDIKPFKDIAWGLSSHGIAVLRFAKRTFVYGSKVAKDHPLAIDDEVTDDAVAACHWAQHNIAIDKKAIFLAGHSLGGYLTPRVAARAENIAGLILLAAPARPFPDVLLDQIKNLLASETNTDKKEQYQKLIDHINILKQKDVKPTNSIDLFGINIPGSYLLSLQNVDPIKEYQTLRLPLFAIQGSEDQQVSVEADFRQWQKALLPNSKSRLYPHLGHLLCPKKEETKLTNPKEADHVFSGVIQDMIRWIKDASTTMKGD
jgi:uncharacterized protein